MKLPRRRGLTDLQRRRKAEKAAERRLGMRPHDWEPVRRKSDPPDGVFPTVRGSGWRCRKCGDLVWKTQESPGTCAEVFARNVMES